MPRLLGFWSDAVNRRVSSVGRIGICIRWRRIHTAGVDGSDSVDRSVLPISRSTFAGRGGYRGGEHQAGKWVAAAGNVVSGTKGTRAGLDAGGLYKRVTAGATS
jgi:hypothetical protein